MNIHPTAIVDKNAEIDENVTIGAYSIIEKSVSIGSGTTIAPYVHIMGNTTIGKNNKIYTGAVIGNEPQDTSFDPQKSVGIKIGDNNLIREHVTIHLSTKNDSFTKIGNGCFIMVGVHIAHDCVLEDNIIMVNNVSLGGHITIEKNAFISGHVGIHQFCRIGAYSMIGSCEKIAQDVVPFTLINDFPARAVGINIVGLKRANFSSEQRKNINRAYRIIFRQKLSVGKAVEQLENEFDGSSDNDDGDENVKYMTAFIKQSLKNGRGILKNR